MPVARIHPMAAGLRFSDAKLEARQHVSLARLRHDATPDSDSRTLCINELDWQASAPRYPDGLSSGLIEANQKGVGHLCSWALLYIIADALRIRDPIAHPPCG
jgi:hypothetical protein